jgi:uncharacterized protein (DUF2237 family)
MPRDTPGGGARNVLGGRSRLHRPLTGFYRDGAVTDPDLGTRVCAQVTQGSSS